ncbi:hypothetical protein [Novosphingopyxis sp.]|uniref:hypothetical protein n=1 Tax=Novosphingopyxis sp. TaxID=2709690 RepID=UPI003B5A64D5
MHIGRLVERFLREMNMPPTTFGRKAINDPRFVRDLRNGREPRAGTAGRVIDFIARERAQRDAA